MDDQVDEDFSITPGHLEQRIDSELESYAGINMTAEYKEKLNVLEWWKQTKITYPCLFKVVKTMLGTPATSVPSERVFSEAGYICRAKRSKILPTNLNRYLFIKQNMAYIPHFTDYFSKEQAEEALEESAK